MHALLQPTLQVSPARLEMFSPLFQSGVQVDVDTNHTLTDLLSRQWGLTSGEIGLISTMMLDGKPVDHPDTTLVRPGITLAFSAAMPGLVGAVMRSSGYFAGLRSGITYHESSVGSAERGRITVKLFNFMIRLLGEKILSRGFWVRAASLVTIQPQAVAAHPDDLVLVTMVE